MNTAIYYFTGTGNSLKVAKDLSQYIEDATVIQIRQEKMSHQLSTNAKAIGFVVPTIFKGIPKLVSQFINHLEVKHQNPYIFAVSTHGDHNGMGIVCKQFKELLAKKSLPLSAYFAIQMPHNSPVKDHLTTNQEKERLFKEETIQIPVIAESIRNRQLISHTRNKFKSYLETLIYSYHAISTSKKPIDRGFYADEKCISCSICSKVCPAQNIEMADNKPKWKLENCQFCLACIQWCPKEAIQYNKETIGIERYHHPEIKVTELIID
ncbi:hypothetical protein BHU72_13240 [Desulfuribacillus stibiiarsenatis]|uniref:4Fe-4S ferredoxin-type domain-containing protein n=1 Tax=Desulfuribacillus stibiiarsenatis TaxID=1390249 RepID=A0A1E5L896_9FIRM|nr:EFR1 family ferrodoxin [Desulfuribacillus stibiiarsenatis]OEH86382.1 hypothetical protein BHU72_13240 [Desulfuribacillus stibiiarsenatis]